MAQEILGIWLRKINLNRHCTKAVNTTTEAISTINYLQAVLTIVLLVLLSKKESLSDKSNLLKD